MNTTIDSYQDPGLLSVMEQLKSIENILKAE